MDIETQERIALTKVYNALHRGEFSRAKTHLENALECGFDPNIGSMLIHAARNGNLEIVKYTLQHDLAQRNVKDFEVSKSCALTFSALKERDEVVEYLIDLGVTCSNLNPKYQPYQNAFNKKVAAQQQADLFEKNIACLKKTQLKRSSVRRRPK